MKARSSWLCWGLLLTGAVAQAQSAPDESWNAYPEDLARPRLPPPPLWPPPLLPPPDPVRRAPPPSLQVLQAPKPPPRPEEFNEVSLFGAPTLAPWKRGLGASMGFPLLGLRVGMGLAEALDAGIAFDSYYGMMNEFRLFGRYQLLQGPHWTASALLEGGAALFTERASAEDHGARWVTGRRNFNLLPGVVLSYRGASPRAARLFLDLRYHLALDTEPYHRNPLGGVPPAFEVGHNVSSRVGAELPLTPRFSFVFQVGLDLHGRDGDSGAMPSCSVGLASAI